MRNLPVVVMFSFLIVNVALAYDNGPRAIGCDYKLGKDEDTGTCLIVGSGTNQGISWVTFEVKKKRFRYADSSANTIELIDKLGKAIAKYSVNRSNGQCRPGGRDADIFAIGNGDRICLYWP